MSAKSILCALMSVGLLMGRADAADVRIELVPDGSEVGEVLSILDAEASGLPVAQADWDRLFATEPYRWLKAREATFGKGLADDDSKAFLAKPETVAQREIWRRSLAAFAAIDVEAIGKQVLAWLPPGAVLKARIFPEIKPQGNSFVWRMGDQGPALFLALRDQSRESFENKIAHELHHIGLNSLEVRQKQLRAGLAASVGRAVEWMGGFGEGEAMLAAAGSADRHPHWMDDAVTRARWDGDMMRFNADLEAVQGFLLDILEGRLRDDAEIERHAAPFWGTQGAWYTVGYEMAALVEKRFGRDALLECMLDPRLLLLRYNRLAGEADTQGATLASWSQDLLDRLQLR